VKFGTDNNIIEFIESWHVGLNAGNSLVIFISAI